MSGDLMALAVQAGKWQDDFVFGSHHRGQDGRGDEAIYDCPVRHVSDGPPATG